MAYGVGDLAYLNAFGALDNSLGTLPEPFPNKYGHYPPFVELRRSTARLSVPPMCSGSSSGLCRTSFASIATVDHAVAYAAGSWGAVTGLDEYKMASGTKRNLFEKGLNSYRWAYDFGIWAKSVGVAGTDQRLRLIANLKGAIEIGNTYVRSAKATVTDTVETKQAEPVRQTTVTVSKPGSAPSTSLPGPTASSSTSGGAVTTEEQKPMTAKIFGLNRNLVIVLGVAVVGLAIATKAKFF